MNSEMPDQERGVGRAGWMRQWCLLLLLLMGIAPRGSEAAVQYLGHAGAHNLYVLNEDGNLFRWGEPRYGNQASDRASSVVPYFESVLTVPPSPSGAPWWQAAGQDTRELLLDASGRAFINQLELNRATRLIEIRPSDVSRSWRSVANGGSLATLVDDAGQLHELRLGALFSWMRNNPGAPLPSPNPWLTHVGRPGEYDTVLEAETRASFSVVRTASGELFGRGYSPWGLAGSLPVEGGDWQRVERPAGVSYWTTFKVSTVSAIALADNGEAYYWGMRFLGSLAADPTADYRVPARLDRPTGVSRWKSVGVVGSLVLLVSEEGALFAFGLETAELTNPFLTSASVMPVATPAIHPALQGTFDSVQCGADYVIARRSDGVDLRWGVFMRLENQWQAGGVDVSPLELPAAIVTLPDRLAPGARMLAPGRFDRVPIGEAVPLRAEVFPLDGPLAFVRFMVNHNLLPGVPQNSGNEATLSWSSLVPGDYTVQVLAMDTSGRTNLTAEVPFAARHAVRWNLSTNRICEVAGEGLLTTAEIQITRTELPYPNYHPFNYRFRIAPLQLLGKDFVIEGANLLSDGSANWEVLFAPGQKTATVRITALEDAFTEPVLNLYIEPAYDWATEEDYLPPGETLSLDIVDAPPAGGFSPVFIADVPESRYSFAGDTVPLAVSIPKSLVELPLVQLLAGLGNWIPYELISIEVLDDRWIYHYTIPNLPVGLNSIVARVRDGNGYGYNRYVDSAPFPVQVWDPSGLPKVRVVAADQSVNENDQPVLSLTVMREGPLTTPLEVALDIRGTALSGSDYTPLPTSVILPVGAGYLQVILTIHDDARPELDETVNVSARQPVCEQLEGCVVADASAGFHVTIRDDDRPPEPTSTGARVIASPLAAVSYLVTASGQVYAWGDNRLGQLGLGGLPAELAGAVPWPRRLEGLVGGERWQNVLLGSGQAMGTTTLDGLFAWGGYPSGVQIPTPRPAYGLPGNSEPYYLFNGSLITRLGTGHLLAYQLGSQSPHRLQPFGAPGAVALRITPQQRILGDDGYFREASDWQGLYPDLYPLAPGAGYWTDVAYSGDVVVAVDELGGLYRILGGHIQFDPSIRRTRRYFTTEPLPPLPSDRVVAQLFGNDLGILVLTTDGAVFTLVPGTNGQASLFAELVTFPTGVSRWTSVAAGQNHFLAVGDDGRVYAWGQNAFGQLGDGSKEAVDVPQVLPIFANVNNPSVQFPVLNLDRPPAVSFFDMAPAYDLGGPEVISAIARAYDPDGMIQRVEFLIDGEVMAAAEFDRQLMAYVASVFVPRPGEHVLTARAWDDSGLFGDSEGIPIHVDDPGLYPVVKVWNIPSGTAEGYGFPGYFIISRQGIAEVPLTVYFDIRGTATEGEDYPALPRSVVIPAGAAEVRLPVIARPDFVDEDTEEINLTILNPGCDPDTAIPGSGCYRIGNPPAAPVYIVNYLRPGSALLPFVSLRLVNSPITREGTTNVAVIEASRNFNSDEDLSVYYELGGTAVNGVDYQSLPGVLVIPAGAYTATFSVAAIEDGVPEPFERVVVTLSNSGCDVETGSAEGCYLSDPANSLVVYVGEKPVPPPLPNSVPRPVLFDDIVCFPGEGTLLSMMSDPGAVFILEFSNDLVHWLPLGELTNTSGRFEFFDVDAANADQRYYRLVAPPDP